jgi:hypothetical protein
MQSRRGIDNIPVIVRMQKEASQMNFATGIELSIGALAYKVVDPMKNCLAAIQIFNEGRMDAPQPKGEIFALCQKIDVMREEFMESMKHVDTVIQEESDENKQIENE